MNLEIENKRKKAILFLFFISFFPFLLLFFDNSLIDNFWHKFANITGFIGTIFLIWQFILGVRGFSKWLTYDYDWIIKIHTFLGINGALMIFLHPILETIVYKKDFGHIIILNFETEFNIFLSLGKIAFFLYLLIWISSSLLRKALKYRLWLYIHYLSYPMILLVLIHPFQIGSFLEGNILVFYYWMLICLIAVLILIFKFLDIFNITNKKFEVIEVNYFPGDTFTIKYKPVESSFKSIFPGQYFYIKKSYISEAHPFSILEYSDDTNELIFGIKKLGKYSTLLSETKVGDIHYLDGPFGQFTFEGHNEDPKVILAGGIGITPFYELVSQFGNKNTFLFYANKNLDTALYRSKFKEILGKNYFDFILDKLDSPAENIFCEVITGTKINELLIGDLNSFKFFICGSPGFTKAMILCLKEIGVSRKNIFIEEFEY